MRNIYVNDLVYYVDKRGMIVRVTFNVDSN